jgi:hypothetical protein
MFIRVFAMALLVLHGVASAQVVPGFKSQYHEMPRIQKMGICHGYHKFWEIAFKSNPYDAGFSKDIADRIASAAGGNQDFRLWSTTAMKFIADAIKADGGQMQVKAFAGVCVELGYPVGQNTGR